MSSLLSRLSVAIGRHRITAVAAWLALLAIFGGLTGYAMKHPAPAASQSMPATDASRALATMQREFGSSGTPSETLKLVVQKADGTTLTDARSVAEVHRLVTQATSLTGAKGATDPFSKTQPFVSRDRTTAVSTITFGNLDDAAAASAHDATVALAQKAPADLKVLVGGDMGVSDAGGAEIGEAVGIAVALLVLMITFGAFRVAGANLLVAFAGVAVASTGILGAGAFTPVQTFSLTLSGMLGIAVGIDYSLFIISRFRSELRKGHGVEEALGLAAGTAGSAVVFAGGTVVAALLGLAVLHIGYITEMGLAGAFGVLVAMLGALTLLPVLLRTLGLRVLPRKERGHIAAGGTVDEETKTPRALSRWAEGVVRRPVRSLVAGLLLAAVMAIPALSMRTVFNVPGGTDPNSMQRQAYTTVVDKFGGVQSPVVVLAHGDHIAAQEAAVAQELKGLPGAQAVVPGAVSTDGQYAMVTVIPQGSPTDESTTNLVHAIRDRSGAIDGVDLQVTGEAAIGIDSTAAMNHALVTYVVLIALVSIVLLTMLFRSLLLPVVATAGFLLTLAAAFGATVAVFQWGWLSALFAAPVGDPLMSLLPIILVGILFGLAMDYQVFLGTRIRELRSQGLPTADAVRGGIRTSGPVVVAAAVIMATVFAGFATQTLPIAAQIAFGLLVGVLVDALLVRMVIVPAVLVLLGDRAWWMPRWLDRVLPSPDVEGRALEETAAVQPARALEEVEERQPMS